MAMVKRDNPIYPTIDRRLEHMFVGWVTQLWPPKKV